MGRALDRPPWAAGDEPEPSHMPCHGQAPPSDVTGEACAADIRPWSTPWLSIIPTRCSMRFGSYSLLRERLTEIGYNGLPSSFHLARALHTFSRTMSSILPMEPSRSKNGTNLPGDKSSLPL